MHLSSCRQTMSGCAAFNQSSRCPSRALTELTFQDASLVKRAGAQPTENELPQPQDDAAFGFFTWNDAPIMSWTKSTSAPLTRSSDVSSTTKVTPSRSNERSSGWRFSSKLKPYWKPEQPPPDTARRRNACGRFSCALSSLTRLAALAERLTLRSFSRISAMSECSVSPLCGDGGGFVKPASDTARAIVRA